MINFFKNLPYKYLFYLGIPVVLIFLSLGYWQFTSYLEVQDRNRLDTHSELPKKTLISEIPSRDIYESIQIQQDLIFVKSWLLRSRVNNGSSGYHLITSYKDNENNQILINKGWIPLSSTLDDVGNESNETYIGILLEYDIKPSIGQDDIKNSDYLFRIEKDLLSNEINAELPPLYLQLTENCGENIICINNDENSDPPHLGYAFQWVFFALCLSLVILRKNKLI